MSKKNMTRQELNEYYYNGNNLLSYNASISFSMGERSMGKTFFFKRKMIDDFLKKGRTSVYLRREQTQIKSVCKTLFDDVIASEPKYQELEFELSGEDNKMIYSINGEPFCVLLNLKAYNKYKGVPFLPYYLFFDEFIEETGKYLKDEKQAFFSIISTVFRDREDFRILMASNSISYYCWLFEMFNIRPDNSRRFFKSTSTNANGKKVVDFVLELSDGSGQRNEDVKQSRLGMLYRKAGLDDYMISNKSLTDNNEHVVAKKPCGFDNLVCCFSFSDKIYGVWSDYSNDSFYVDTKNNQEIPSMYKVYMTEDDKKQGWISIKSARNYAYIGRIKKRYYDGLISFDSVPTKVDFIEYILKYL